MATSDINPVRVLIAGGSYAGLSTLVALLNYSYGDDSSEAAPTTTDASKEPTPPLTPRRRIPITIDLVDERDGFLHLIGCPLAFASHSYASKIWVPFASIPALAHPAVTVHRARVTAVDTDTRTATLRAMDDGHAAPSLLRYDYLVAATGLRRVHPVVPAATTREAYLAEVGAHIARVQRAATAGSRHGLVVAGGGAVGVEMAAEAKLVFGAQLKVTLVHSRARLLSAEPLPAEVGEAAAEALRQQGVVVLLGQRAVVDEAEVETEDGERVARVRLGDGGAMLLADVVVNALSRHVSTAREYLPAKSLDDDGLVKVDTMFRFLPGHRWDAHHLACGDIVAWKGIKRCGGAIHSAARVADNIYQQMLWELDGLPTKIEPWPVDVPGMIGLAIGSQALGYHPDTGLKVGEDQLEYLFKDDLAFKGEF